MKTHENGFGESVPVMIDADCLGMEVSVITRSDSYTGLLKSLEESTDGSVVIRLVPLTFLVIVVRRNPPMAELVGSYTDRVDSSESVARLFGGCEDNDLFVLVDTLSGASVIETCVHHRSCVPNITVTHK